MAKEKKFSLDDVKGIEILRKSFDNVIHEINELYQTLELSNNVNKNGIDKVVYLKLNIALSSSSGRGVKECIEGAVGNLVPWIDLLLCHDEKKTKVSQLSLFNDDVEEDLEKEPESPKGETGNWDKYFRNRDKSRINNMKKKYKFFDLFDPLTWWWAYHIFDYKKFIPTQEDMLVLVKNAIVKYKDNDGRHDDVWLDNTSYVRNKTLSDTELFSRVMSILRLYIQPWQIHRSCMYDDSYTIHLEPISKTGYLFYMDNGKIYLHYSAIKNSINMDNKQEKGAFRDELITYDLFTDELISFLRNEFNVSECEPLNDSEAKKILIKSFADSVNNDWQNILNNSSTYKEFKTKLFHNVDMKQINLKHPILTDDYDFVMNMDKTTPHLQITQRTNTRKRLDYSFDGSFDMEYWKYIVEFVEGDEVFKLLFNLYREETVPRIIQTTLFDFLGAA